MSATVEAWETEDPTLVVYGTHHVNEALKVSKKFYMDNVGEVPEGLRAELFTAFLRDGRLWADPKVRDLDEERWPSHMMSSTEIEGWVPFLVVNW